MYAPTIDPVAFTIGSFRIHWYGLMYLFGFIIALLLAKYRARHSSFWASQDCDDLLTFIALGVILGGRAGYVLFYDFSYYFANPMESIAIWKGGMSFHGGLLGVLIALWLFAKTRKRHFLDTVDFIAPFVAPSIFLGRIGNFMNGELWGRVSDLPWAMVFPSGGNLPRHPSQLYEALGEGIILFIIVWVYSLKPRHRGAVASVFAICYSIARIAVEFVREPDGHIGFIAFEWLTMGQLLSFVVLLISIILFLNAKKQPIVNWRVKAPL
ncbi:MAG: prolipoprotein diacylglyceryl transferase [Desulfovibrionaceae bacterium]